MKRISFLLLTLLALAVIALSATGCYSNSNETENSDVISGSETIADSNEHYDVYDIIVEIANAYDRQGAQIPYDQYNARRSIYSSPEDATAQRTIFLDCSSFVNACYLEGFGVNVLPYEPNEKSPNTKNFDDYARDNSESVDVVGYWVPADYPSGDERESLVNWIYENLEIGDILTYRHGTPSKVKGHTYIYLGNNSFMHCAGAGSYVTNASKPSLSYDSNANEIATGGTISTISADAIFKQESHGRYIFKATNSDTVFSFGIIRPFARELVPTEKTLSRMKVAGLSMEKTASVCENSAVFYGTHLTYTVTLENTNDYALADVKVTDALPSGTEFISGDSGVKVSKGKLSWTGSVPAKSKVEVSYTVKITEKSAGTLIISDKTCVSGVNLGVIKHTVSSLTETQLALIAETALEYVNRNQKFDSTLDMVKSAYATHGIELFDYSEASALLDMLIDTENLTCHTSTDVSDILVPNLYGGLSIKYGWLYLAGENDKTRLPKEEHLSVGDIILADWKGGTAVYFYAGNHVLITVQSGSCTALTIGENIYTAGENIIISLLGYDRYAVIRPAMREASMPDITSISVTQPPLKRDYERDDRFDSTGMVVTAALNDGTERIITNYKISPLVLTPDVSKVTVAVGNLSESVDITVSNTKTIYGVSSVSELDIDEKGWVEGIVVGVAHEGKNNDTELLLKDLKDDTVIAVRNLGSSFSKKFGYQVGDRIVFRAIIKKDTSASTNYSLKKYLEFSEENDSQESTVVSSGNEISYTFKDAVEVNTWEDMKQFFDKEKTRPYTYLKINGGVFLNLNTGDGTDSYRLHNNDKASGSADIKSDGASICLRSDTMSVNLGSHWKELLFSEETKEYPGVFVNKDLYAIYIGGNKTYYQLVILDDSWILDNK